MKTKTLTLKHYDQTFDLKMSDGSKHEITIKNRDSVSFAFCNNPWVLRYSPEELLERWIESRSVVDGLNLSHVVNFMSGEISNQREEQITYKKHWWWGWRKDETLVVGLEERW